jgi:bacillithiol system protein YtxJ
MIIELTSVEEWERLFEQSDNQPYWLLKHSTACMISARAYRQVKDYMRNGKYPDIQIYVVKVIEDRQISNQIEMDMKVRHASPQLLLMSRPVAFASLGWWDVVNA